MDSNYCHPVTVAHRGLSILFAMEKGSQPARYAYNILQPRPDSNSDQDDWTGYRSLPFPTELAPAGMSLVRTQRSPETSGLFCALSDQEYVYLFRAAATAIYVNRYRMVEKPHPRVEGKTIAALELAWEVRYRYSGNADVPASEKDIPNALGPDGTPFPEPTYELSLDLGGTDLIEASFSVLLAPTSDGNVQRWQIFVPDLSSGWLQSYSLARTEDGWFSFDADQVDAERHLVQPDMTVRLRHGDKFLELCGPLAATSYVKQEPALTGNEPVLKMKRGVRVLLVAPVREVDTLGHETRGLATLDFAVGTDGHLSGLQPPETGERSVEYEVGVVAPCPSVLSFDTVSAVHILPSPSAEELRLPPTFTLEAWVFPTSDSLATQILVGGEIGTPDMQRAPSVWIQDKLRVGAGFGNGERLVSNVTRDNVLTLSSWNHVAVAHDADGLAIYVNGHAVALANDVIPGMRPARTPVTSLGANATFALTSIGGKSLCAAPKTDSGFEGMLDEVRLWSKRRTSEEILAFVFAQIPESEAKQDAYLQAYWRFDEGGGGESADLSQYLRKALLAGAHWVHTSSPLIDNNREKLYFDRDGRVTYVGIIVPDIDHPHFGDVAADTRPTLLDGADGLVHLYYMSGQDGRFYVAQFDATIERACYALPWIARALDPAPPQIGNLYLMARQSGTSLNKATLTVKVEGPSLPTWVFEDGLDNQETWKGMPSKLADAVSILSGQATSQPTDPGVAVGTKVCYDYAGTRPMGFVPIGDALSLTSLQFLSGRAGQLDAGGVLVRGEFEARHVTLANVQGTVGDVTLTISSDSEHPDERLVRVLPKVPTDVAALALTLAGSNPSYPYDAAVPDVPQTTVYAIPAKPLPISAFVPPEAAVENASLRVAAAADGDPLHCNFFARLELTKQGGPVEAEWQNVPRAGTQFVQALKAGSLPEQKAVIAKLRLMAPTTTVQNGLTSAAGDARGFLSLLTVVSNGATGSVQPFDCPLDPMQGATATRAGSRLDLGSNLFAIMPPGETVNGYPAVLDLGKTGKVQATLFKPGKAGGWVPEPPRVAIRIHDQGNLAVDPTGVGIGSLALQGDVTLESWAQILETAPGQNAFFGRIIHANLPDQPSSPRYFLGLVAGSALQFDNGSSVATSDGEADAALKLFPNDEYTLQLYVRPDLSTPDGTNTIVVRKTDKGSERLEIDKDGTLHLTITSGEQEVVVDGGHKLTCNQWQMITVTRTNQQLTVYIDGGDPRSLASPPNLRGESSRVVLGGNTDPHSLQVEMNQLAIWSKARSASEVASGRLVSVPADDDGLRLLWGLDDSSQEDFGIPNTAVATQGLYNSKAEGSLTFWDCPGLFYRLFAVCRDLALQSAPPVAAFGEWHHYAATYQCQYGLALDGVSYADCGNDDSLNVQSVGLSLEAWVWPAAPNGNPMAIASKMGSDYAQRSYELGLDGTGRPYVTLRVDGTDADERFRSRTFKAATALQAGKGYHVVGTGSIVSVQDAATNQNYDTVVGQVFVNGVPKLPGPECILSAPNDGKTYYKVSVLGGSGSGWYPEDATVTVWPNETSLFSAWRGDVVFDPPPSPPPPPPPPSPDHKATFKMPKHDVVVTPMGIGSSLTVTRSKAALSLGRALSGGTNDQPTAHLRGGLSDVRLWNRALGKGTIAQAFASRTPPSTSDGLVASWNFTEQTGRLAADGRGNSNALLSSSSLWSHFYDGARLSLFVDGKAVSAVAVNPGDCGDYGPSQFRIGANLDGSGAYGNPFLGVIDEIRVWKVSRTHEQLTDNMNRYLTGWDKDLAGYWCFDAGSGDRVTDVAGHGNDAVFEYVSSVPARPEWIPSSAPISNEAPPVKNALGGLDAAYVRILGEGPAVFEYSDTQVDAHGNYVSVMKRGYAFVANGQLNTWVGYKVGDLQRVYIGQVQTKPSLMGFIEGAPPLPSENLTRPYYWDSIGSYFGYDGIGKIMVKEASGTKVSFSGSREDKGGIEFSFKFGAENDKILLVPVPPLTPTVLEQEGKWAWKAGLGTNIEWSQSDKSESSLGSEITRTVEHSLESGGSWEAPDKVYLRSGERRYLPGNDGYAVVKSATADIYGLFLGTTGALVGLSVVPNRDIPEDVNLISFPIDPQYVHNGSLDGRVGLQADPESGGQPSYYRPVEAYSLQRQVERQNVQLAAWYAQFDAARKGKSKDCDLDTQASLDPCYDWSNGKPRKDMLCKYVWSADGGLYREQEGYVSSRRESYGGAYEFAWSFGGLGELSFELGPVGIFSELELMGGQGFTIEVVKDKEETSALEMDVDIAPEGCLSKYVGTADKPQFSETRVPGKVDTYRFATFYLAPTVKNTSEFFSKVIDRLWLDTSSEPRAAALREAMAVSQGQSAWRVLHRVTFVSRVPPEFQPVPTESAAPPLADPAHLDGNTLCLELVRLRLGDAASSPTAAQIAAAVRDVVLDDLKVLVPWWNAFLARAQQANTAESAALRTIISNMNQYMVTYCAARKGKLWS